MDLVVCSLSFSIFCQTGWKAVKMTKVLVVFDYGSCCPKDGVDGGEMSVCVIDTTIPFPIPEVEWM